MDKSAASVKPLPPRFQVGDRVRILHGFRGVLGEVVEDRGNLGVGGERMYGVRMRMDPWNEMTSEFPEQSLEAVSAGKRAGQGD
jgi:hypothetical protein